MTCDSENATRISGGHAASGEARAVATAQVGDLIAVDCLRDLHVLLSEVVNNSVLHGGVGEDGWIEILLHADDDRVRCAVRDSGKQGHPELREPDFENGGGFGLFLVEEMAARWGVERDPTLTVWFELDLSG